MIITPVILLFSYIIALLLRNNKKYNNSIVDVEMLNSSQANL